MSDKAEYLNYADLKKAEKEGINFSIHVLERESAVAIIAPHGGVIEPTTGEIATAIAGDAFNFYCFNAIDPADKTKTLHITSNRFDEPHCLALISKNETVVAVHGLADKTTKHVDVGGLDLKLRDLVCKHLTHAGFVANPVSTGDHAGIHPLNICNRGRNRKGVQLEITRALRDELNGDKLQAFANAIRSAIYART